MDLWPWSDTVKLFGASGLAALLGATAAHFTPGHELSIIVGIAGFVVAFVCLAMVFRLANDEDWALARRWLTLKVFS
jgi:uncharacterized membrane protein YfcA